ncbi:MAG: hypothetical protein M0Z50_05775 [Planctomycetia bacterium]|nr:hypothetical protein [Planctomycetia bacterium]
MGGRQEVLDHRKDVKEITEAALRGDAIIGQDDRGINQIAAGGKRVLLSDIENPKAFYATHGKKPWEKARLSESTELHNASKIVERGR